MTTPGEKTKQRREELHLTQTELAQAARWSRAYLSKFERNQVGYSDKGLRRLADALGRTPDWLLQADEGMNAAAASLHAIQCIDHGYIIPWLRGEILPAKHWVTIYVYTQPSKRGFALKVHGDSMAPEFLPGHIVVIEPETEPVPGDIVLIRSGENSVVLRQYVEVEVGASGEVTVEFRPLNRLYPSIVVKGIDSIKMRLLGTMEEHTRFRKKPVS